MGEKKANPRVECDIVGLWTLFERKRHRQFTINEKKKIPPLPTL